MDLGLKGKKAIITGGSKGIGLATAHALADEGVDVAICSRKADDVNAALEALKGKGINAIINPTSKKSKKTIKNKRRWK